MTSKWAGQEKIDKAVLAVLYPLGDEGTTFDALLHFAQAPDRTALSRSLQRLIGQALITQSHDARTGAVSRYARVVPTEMRERFTEKANA